jgi:hypothetical protein
MQGESLQALSVPPLCSARHWAGPTALSGSSLEESSGVIESILRHDNKARSALEGDRGHQSVGDRPPSFKPTGSNVA